MKTQEVMRTLAGLIGLYLVVRYAGTDIAPTLSGVALVILALAFNAKS